MSSSTFFADDPVNGTPVAPDQLGRNTYAAHLVTLLDRISTQSESSVLALIGPWGGGKSSVLGMTMNLLRRRDGWQIAEFNPWAFSNLDTMLVGFFSEISAALPDEVKPKEIRKRIGEVVEQLSPLGKVGGLVGVDAESAIGHLSRLVKGDTSPTTERHKLAHVLRAAKRRILVVLDDLDRLAPAELLLVLKLVRFVGRLPNVYYLLSYDERTLLDVLVQTELCGSIEASTREARAHDYLEKIVQVRLDLPPLLEKHATRLLHSGIDRLITSLGIAATPDRRERFFEAYEKYMRHRLATPRAINRYLAQVDALYTILGEEVDFFDFALLTFIRTFEPTLYARLYRIRTELTVDRAQIGVFQDEVNHSERWHEVLRLAQMSATDTKEMIGLLGELFLPIALTQNNDTYLHKNVQELADRKGVGHRDYFDRYFSFAVPEDDLSDARLEEMLAALGSTDAGERELARHLVTDTERTLRKISLRRPHVAHVGAAILELLGRYFDDLSDEPAAGRSSQRMLAQRLAEDILEERPEETNTLLCHLGTSLGGVLLSTRLLSSSRIRKDAQIIAENSDRLRQQLQPYPAQPFTKVSNDVKNLIFIWRMVDQHGCRDWLRTQIEAGQWDALDIAGWTISTRVQNGQPILDSFDDDLVDNYLGINYLLEMFSARLDREVEGRTFIDSSEDRRLATLYALRNLRQG